MSPYRENAKVPRTEKTFGPNEIRDMVKLWMESEDETTVPDDDAKVTASVRESNGLTSPYLPVAELTVRWGEAK